MTLLFIHRFFFCLFKVKIIELCRNYVNYLIVAIYFIYWSKFQGEYKGWDSINYMKTEIKFIFHYVCTYIRTCSFYICWHHLQLDKVIINSIIFFFLSVPTVMLIRCSTYIIIRDYCKICSRDVLAFSFV